MWHCANQPYFDRAERLKQKLKRTRWNWNETKRCEMRWDEMCAYTRLLILYHSDHNLWKFVFVFFPIYFVCLFVCFLGNSKQKNKWKLSCVFVADVLLLSLSTTIINSFKLTVNYIFRLMCSERKTSHEQNDEQRQLWRWWRRRITKKTSRWSTHRLGTVRLIIALNCGQTNF